MQKQEATAMRRASYLQIQQFFFHQHTMRNWWHVHERDSLFNSSWLYSL